MMGNRIFSREFLGITLVPYTTRPRIVSKAIYANGYYLAICGKNKVVISSDECFKHSFERSDYAQRQVARALLALEAISQDTYNEFSLKMKAEQTDKARQKMQSRAAELEDLLQEFGLKLSNEQNDKVNSMLKIEAV